MKPRILRLVCALSLLLVLSTVTPAQTVATVGTNGSLSANGTVVLNVAGYASAAFQLLGTWTGTATFKVSNDASTWIALNVVPPNSTSTTTTATGNGGWTGSVAGWKWVEVDFAWSTGTVQVIINATPSGGGTGGGGGGGSNAAAGATGSAVPSSASYTGFNSSGTLVGASSANPFPVTIISGGGTGGTSLADGGTFTAGTTSDTPIAGLYEVSPSTCTTGKACAAGITTGRAFKVDFSSLAGTAVDVNSGNKSAGTLRVVLATDQPAVPVSQSGTWTVQPGNTANTTPWLFTPYQNSATLFPNAAALADSTSNPTTTGLASYNMCWNGTTWDRCKSSTAGNGATDTSTQRVTIANDSTGQIKATNFPTTVTLNGGASDASTLRVVNDPLWGGSTAKGVSSAITTTTSTQVIAAVASNYLYITSCTVTQSSTTVGTAINLQDGSGGTTIDTIPAPAAANSVVVTGSHIIFPTPLKVTTLGNGLYAAAVTTGSNFVVACQGFSSTVSR